MKTDELVSRIPTRYWGYLALFLWGGIAIFLLRQDLYGLDEGASRNLLLVWSIVEQVANAAVAFGTPDLRLLLFFPVGFLKPGSVIAVKIFTILLVAGSAWLLYVWQRNRVNAESALLATGLLLISPLLLAQVDALAPGIYLLIAFSLGEWLNNTYRAAPKPFGGNYFAQMILCAFSTSLHPAGLAYPLTLAWAWHKDAPDAKQKKYFLFGIGFVTLLTLIVRMGWSGTEWLHNPLDSLSAIVFGPSIDGDISATRWATGAFAMALLLITVFKQFRALRDSFTGRVLLLGLILGAFVGDLAWALIALTTILYFGFPSLLRAQELPFGNFFGQRGIALLVLVILSTSFMLANKSRYEAHQAGLLSQQDQLIKTLADITENFYAAQEEESSTAPQPHLRVASQWPARTMIACKCDTLPLPPAEKDPETQLARMLGVSYLLFDYQSPNNMALYRNLSMLGEYTETIDLQSADVLVRITAAPSKTE
ncbi:MAG: hypothetical protein LBE50_04275 [Gallionellaceae bacterium]|jgi:hypothetical protein|nr:hypothetical protein [Gallionellaceae bacterium]